RVKPALLLIGLGSEQLAAAGLRPAAPELVARAAVLLDGFRARGLPVIHVGTAGGAAGAGGTAGHYLPAPLRPRSGEAVVAATVDGGFEGGGLDGQVRALDCDAVVVAGTPAHGGVRAAALDAWRRGYPVAVADDATGSDDP